MKLLKKGIMSRMDWFTNLRIIFENIPRDTLNTGAVLKSDFIKHLINSQSVIFNI